MVHSINRCYINYINHPIITLTSLIRIPQKVSCMGAHITSVPNHQTKRTAILKTRFVVALWGTFGLELNLTKLSQEELDEVNKGCYFYTTNKAEAS